MTDIDKIINILESFESNSKYVTFEMSVLNKLIHSLFNAKCGDCKNFCKNTKQENKENENL